MRKQLLRGRWRGEERRIAAITRDLCDEKDWTANLLASDADGWGKLAGIDSCPKAKLQGEAAPRDLRGVELSNLGLMAVSGLADTSLDYAQLTDISLRKCSLVGASLRHAKVAGDSFLDDANLEGADLHFAELRDISLAGASMSSASIIGADLEGADLRGCCLRRVTYNKEGVFGFAMKRRWTQFGGEYQAPGSLHSDSDPGLRRYIASERNRLILQKNHSGLAFLWYVIGNFGRSPGRLLLWVCLVWGGFGFLYAGFPLVPCLRGTAIGRGLTALEPRLKDDTSEPIVYKSGFAPLYFSAATLTTLGYGDIRPALGDSLAQAYVSLEAAMGYLLLGGFVSILLQNSGPPD